MRKRVCLPKLGRMGKTARNLLLCLPMLIGIWQGLRFPLPTLEMNFRRMERVYMLPEGELVYRADGLFVDEGKGQVVIGEMWAADQTTNWYYSCDLRACPLEDGPSLVPLSGRQVLVLHVPEETARAELTLTADQRSGTAEGERAGDGLWSFTFSEEYQANCSSWRRHAGSEGWPYVLRLYGQDGGLLLERTAVTPLLSHRQELHTTDDCD